LVERISDACAALLPDATVIVHGSLALGDFQPGRSDIDLLVTAMHRRTESWRLSNVSGSSSRRI
jgi:predicted nucleotidyltransferase